MENADADKWRPGFCFWTDRWSWREQDGATILPAPIFAALPLDACYGRRYSTRAEAMVALKMAVDAVAAVKVENGMMASQLAVQIVEQGGWSPRWDRSKGWWEWPSEGLYPHILPEPIRMNLWGGGANHDRYKTADAAQCDLLFAIELMLQSLRLGEWAREYCENHRTE